MYYGEFQSLATLKVGGAVRLRRPSNISLKQFARRVNNATNHFARTRSIKLKYRTMRDGVTIVVTRVAMPDGQGDADRAHGLRYGNSWD